jgi:hypothetical protein
LPFPDGAAFIDRTTLYVLVESARSIGPALALAQQRGVDNTVVLADDGAGRLRHQAAQFAREPGVFALLDRDIVEVVPEAPEPRARSAPPGDLVALLQDAALQVVDERERTTGELRGLEVARIDAGGSLQVGVGQADRELTAMLHGDLTPAAALARVVDVVGGIRRADGDAHPLKRLVPERWLRWVLTERPDLVGMQEIEPLPGPEPRRGLRERDVAYAVAWDDKGAATFVACSVGVDLDLVPVAAAARAALMPDAPLLLVVPERDAHPVTRALASALRAPAALATVADDWRLAAP